MRSSTTRYIQSEWTEARTDELTRRWLAGESASQIVDALGGTTRNAVIGKVHRLKLGSRQNPRMNKPKVPPIPKVHGNRGQPKANAIMHRVATAELKPPRIMPAPTDLPEMSARRRLIDLRANECRFCDGDPLTADHSFCGAPVKEGSSWCPSHHARVFS